jgi:hypothetical protein
MAIEPAAISWIVLTSMLSTSIAFLEDFMLYGPGLTLMA